MDAHLWWLSIKESSCQCLSMQETWIQSLIQEDPLEKEMATHSSILPEKSHRQRREEATVHGVAKSWT